MKEKNLIILIIIIFALILLVGLIYKNFNIQVSDYESFIKALEKKGLNVTIEGSSERIFFKPIGMKTRINGEGIEAFEYENEEASKRASKLIKPDGYEVGNVIINWKDDPHFYQKGRIIVFYIGKNNETIGILESLLGNQIAGKTYE